MLLSNTKIEQLKGRMKCLRFNASMIARALGVAKTTTTRLFAGKHEPLYDTIVRVEEFLTAAELDLLDHLIALHPEAALAALAKQRPGLLTTHYSLLTPRPAPQSNPAEMSRGAVQELDQPSAIFAQVAPVEVWPDPAQCISVAAPNPVPVGSGTGLNFQPLASEAA